MTAGFQRGGDGMRVLVVGDRLADREEYRKVALRIGLDCGPGDCVPPADVRLRLAREPAVDLVVVAIGADPAAAAGLIQQTAAETGLRVFAVTSDGGAHAREQVERSGAAGVWSAERLREELVSTATGAATGPAYTRGRVIAVTAAHPGAGATTVATGLAFGLAKGGPALLTELGTGSPELALDLDLEFGPQHSLAELVRESRRMDARMLRNAVARHPAGVDVLAYTPETLSPEPLTPAAVRDFQVLVRHTYPWCVVDAGHPSPAPREGTDEWLRHAEQVVVVARLDPPSLRLTRRYLQTLAGIGVAEAAVAVVANRYGQPGQVPWRKAQEALKADVRAWLPDDPRAVNSALSEGRPLAEAARRSRLNRQLVRLASEIRTRLAPARR